MVNLTGLTQGIVSAITFFQNLGVTINLPGIDMSDELREIGQYVTKFLETILSLIPHIPAFDIRAQLVIIAVMIPMILNIAFVWFISRLVDTVMHVIDLAVVVIVAMITAQTVLQGDVTVGVYLVAALGFVYLMLRIITALCRERKKEKPDMTTMSRDICCYYMAGVIPKVKTTNDLETLTRRVNSFSRSVDLRVVKPGCMYVMFMGLFILALIAVSIWSLNVIPVDIGVDSPAWMQMFVPYIGLPLAAVLLILLIMRLTACGRNVILKLKRFTKRWGLRLLMLFLDLLYIPILTNLVTLCTPGWIGCGEGSYLAYDRIPEIINPDPFFEFVNHTTACTVCGLGNMIKDECAKVCSVGYELRVQEAPNLLFVDDMLKTSGGLILYVVVAIMFGIPAFWGYVIHRNKKFVVLTYVYGETINEKWKAVVHRLETTGVFLFAYYRYDRSYWSLFIFFSKFILMVITTVAGRLWSAAVILLPFWYTFVVIVITQKFPYLYKSNNWLDILLYSVNAAFSVVPVFANYGRHVSGDVFMPLSIAMLAIPVVSLIVMICCKHKVFDNDDPTLSDDDKKKQKTNQEKGDKKNGNKKNGNEKKGDKKKGNKKKGNKKKENKHKEEKLVSVEDNSESDFDSDFEGDSEADRLTTAEEKAELKRQRRELADATHKRLRDSVPDAAKRAHLFREVHKEVGNDLGTEVHIGAGFTDSIRQAEVSMIDPNYRTKAYSVGDRFIMRRMKHMYRTLDVVIDGSTIELVTRGLSTMMICACVGFGWYLGAVRGVLRITSQVNCG